MTVPSRQQQTLSCLTGERFVRSRTDGWSDRQHQSFGNSSFTARSR